MIRILPGGISAAEALTSTCTCIASKTTRMLHILHILAFPEPRFVNLGFFGNDNPDVRISGGPYIRFSEFPEIRKFDACYVLAPRH